MWFGVGHRFGLFTVFMVHKRVVFLLFIKMEFRVSQVPKNLEEVIGKRRKKIITTPNYKIKCTNSKIPLFLLYDDYTL